MGIARKFLQQNVQNIFHSHVPIFFKLFLNSIGLDPAEPDYKGTDPVVHLDTSDANFVDIIHSDGSEFDYVSG